MNLVESLRRTLMEEITEEGELTDEEVLDRIDDLVISRTKEIPLTIMEKEQMRKDLFYSVRKLDVLQELVEDNSVTEIMVNGPDRIYLERNGKIERWGKQFASKDRLYDVIHQIAGRCNRVVNEQSPIVDARLENGDRVNVVLPPVSLEGPILTIRRFPEQPITMEQLVRWDSLTSEAAKVLKDLVQSGYSILVGGGTGSGKTTFLNALSDFIPKQERIITIEDNAELQIQGVENLVRLEAKISNTGEDREITIRDLIRTSLRMRPDRIIVGEVRGGEAEDFLNCLNTGHSGSLCTAHANSVKDMLGRLEMMVLMGMDLPIPVIQRQIVAGIDILVHLNRDGQGRRRVAEISEILDSEGGEIKINPLFVRDKDGVFKKAGSLENREKLEKYYGLQ